MGMIINPCHIFCKIVLVNRVQSKYNQHVLQGYTDDTRSIVFEVEVFIPHDDVIKWKHFPRYWPFVRGIHRSPVNSPHKGQWRGALIFCLICFWVNGWVNNREAGVLRRYRAHYDVTLMGWFTVEFLRVLEEILKNICICEMNSQKNCYLKIPIHNSWIIMYA